VTATRLNSALSGSMTLRAIDLAGNVTNCDPILTEVGKDGPGGAPRSETYHHLARGESQLTVTNGVPGLDRLRVVVNGRQFELRNLDDGETRTLDVSSAMRKGDNTITLIAQGKDDGIATVLIADH
jgi:hypothetical protein